MSRIGKMPIPLPPGVKVTWQEPILTVSKGSATLTRPIHGSLAIAIAKDQLTVTPIGPPENNKPLWGLFRTLINNMVVGVSTGFTKVLEVVGVGWRVEALENKGAQSLKLSLGFSHPVEFPLPPTVKATVDAKANKITLVSPDKELLGLTAARIRSYRKPEPYKGKGVKYEGEKIRRKVGKAGGKAGGK
ncbi:MAG: 50S ribosomal protein L6 [Deltaproteobacteria bacterium]|jgi:large subunit ribosomal protein L6|nr:50S ribosomal protein L6 [Deltaproteobacteria bacterium]